MRWRWWGLPLGLFRVISSSLYQCVYNIKGKNLHLTQEVFPQHKETRVPSSGSEIPAIWLKGHVMSLMYFGFVLSNVIIGLSIQMFAWVGINVGHGCQKIISFSTVSKTHVLDVCGSNLRNLIQSIHLRSIPLIYLFLWRQPTQSFFKFILYCL